MASLPLTIPASTQDTRWKALLDPVIANPLQSGQLLTGIPLASGTNTINHGLGRQLRGYFIVMNSASATFYDNQSTNQMPQLTLILNSSAPTTVSLYVF
jgi:hypothetical protein